MLSVSLLYSVKDGTTNEIGEAAGMKIGRGNKNTRINPIPEQLYSS
jgi:hypothetical protein